jgi:uncharacterized protein
MMTRILLSFLAFYRRWLSPALHSLSPDGCKFVPTCSEYAQEAITVHGPLKGSVLAVGRVLRCHPFGRGGFDPVPIPIAARPFPHEPLPWNKRQSSGLPVQDDRK